MVKKKSISRKDHNLHLGENSVKTGYEILVFEKKGFYLQVVYYIPKFIPNPWLSLNFYGLFSYEIHLIKRFAILVLQENKQNIKHTF